MLEDEANRRVLVRLALGVDSEVYEVRECRNRDPARSSDDKRRCVNLGWVDVCCRSYLCHRVYSRAPRGDHPTPIPRPSTAMPDEAWEVPSVVLTAVVVATAVHAEEVRASFDPALPKALGEFPFPMRWFAEAHR